MRSAIVTDIQWEKDGHKVDLPFMVIVQSIPHGVDDEDVHDAISDRLSDVFGWLHNGFIWEYLDELPSMRLPHLPQE
jgi:hypothetical protein